MNKYLFKVYQFLIFKKRGFTTSPMKILKDLQKSQYWSREKVRKYQLDKINKLIQDAKKNTIFYKNIPFDPFNSIDEFTKSFPKLDKSDIVENRDEFINDKTDHKHKHTTSGTTGQPISFDLSSLTEAHRLASIMRFYSWWKIKPHDRSVLIWGFKKTTKYTFLQKISHWFHNRLDINVFDLNEKTVVEYFKKIEKFEPHYIRGYTIALSMLAEFMEEHNLRFKKSKLKTVIVTGEILYENTRKHMEKIFGCRVANEYGASDCGLYAQECPDGSMHINEELILITVSKDNVCHTTELNNNGMPIINYINNDGLVISEDYCSCGRTSRLVEEIEGRGTDQIELPDGTKKNPAIFYYIIQELNDIGFKRSVKQYKVFREKDDFLMHVVPDLNFKVHVTEYIEKRMQEELGEECMVATKVVSEVLREESGKLRTFVNKS